MKRIFLETDRGKKARKAAAAAALSTGLAATAAAAALSPEEEKGTEAEAGECASHEYRMEDTRTYAVSMEREMPPTEEELRRDRGQELLQKTKGILLLPLQLLLESIFALIKLPLKLAGGLLLKFVLRVLFLMGLGALVWKLLFPDASFKDIFGGRKWLYYLLGSVLLTVADGLLTRYLEQWKWIRILLMAAVSALVLFLLWKKIWGRLKRRSPKKEVLTVQF